MKGILSRENLVMIEGFQGLFGNKTLKKIIRKMLDKLLMIIMIHRVSIKTYVRLLIILTFLAKFQDFLISLDSLVNVINP